MSSKPTYNLHRIGPVYANCGVNYLKKRPLSNRCPACRRSLPAWLVSLPIGLVLGLAGGWLFARDIPQAGQVAIAAGSVAAAVGLAWRQWVKR